MTKIFLAFFTLATVVVLYSTYSATSLETIDQKTVRSSHSSYVGGYSSGGSWGYGK